MFVSQVSGVLSVPLWCVAMEAHRPLNSQIDVVAHARGAAAGNGSAR